MAIESIAKTLGTGSGIDITALVDQLVQAQFENKNKQLESKNDALTAQISKLGELKSGISDFSSALTSLTTSGSLATQPTSSNSGIVSLTRLAGADLNGLNATLEVRQLAQSQVTSSSAFAGGATTSIGTGTLTLTFGNATVADGAMTGFTAGAATPIDITIDSAHSTLQGVADAINAKKAGVTASIVNDSSGARLVLKSATGGSQAFTLQGSGALSTLDVGVGATGTTINTSAQNSIVALDGVETSYPTNNIYGLIEGTRIDLVSASPGTKVSVGSQTPTTELTQSVSNFVETYNQVYKLVKDAVDPVSGPLRRDPAAKDLLRQLSALTLAPLIPGASSDEPQTLADLGVATGRDGTLSVNSARLASVAADYPAQLEKMFSSTSGIGKALGDVAARATDRDTGLGVSEANYTRQQADVTDDKDAALAAAESMRTRMTRQFAGMDAIVASYKSTQSFLEQQVAAWNQSG